MCIFLPYKFDFDEHFSQLLSQSTFTHVFTIDHAATIYYVLRPIWRKIQGGHLAGIGKSGFMTLICY